MRKRILIGMLAAVVAFLAVGLLVPNLRAPRLHRSRVVCETNLRHIYTAKQLWVADVRPTNQTPAPPGLIEKYLGQNVKLVCPSGGHYECGAFKEGPSCSCGHRLTADGALVTP